MSCGTLVQITEERKSIWSGEPYTRERKRLVGGAERQEILCAFDRFLQAAEKLLQILAAFHEIDFGGVNHQEVCTFIAKEEMLVGAGDFLEVLRRDLLFLERSLFGEAGTENFRFGLKIDDQVGLRKFAGKGFIIAFVEF